MTRAAAEGAGARHLQVLTRGPRPAGGDAEREARAHAASSLTSAGFSVREERFSYSAFPGRYATPLGGLLLGGSIVATALTALDGRAHVAAMVLVVGVVGTALFARWMSRAVVGLPLMRAESANLVATRGSVEPHVWLVAHLDSKSQPVPSAVRIGGVLVVGLALALSLVALALQLRGGDPRTLWWLIVLAAVAGAIPVLASVVGASSDGAVDNASGAAAVLAATALLEPGIKCGVLMPSAEELGLAGASAWARTRRPSTAINCDGVDDHGDVVIMYNGACPSALVTALRAAATRRASVRRMPLGLLTDSTALARAGWRTATVSHGSLATLRRVHRPTDSLEHMRGTAIDEVALILARAVEALS
ncbi:MAG: M28 family peptidase [Gemmatimonadaceae bacterium]